MAKERWITVNGNHILIKEGQSVKEALGERFGNSRKKRIKDGKYEYSVDGGKTYEDLDRDSYDELEADEDSFDENEDSDFEAEDNAYTEIIHNMKDDDVDLEDPREVLEYLGANMGLDEEDQIIFMEKMGYSVDDINKIKRSSDWGNDDEIEAEDNVSQFIDDKELQRYADRYDVSVDDLKEEIIRRYKENDMGMSPKDAIRGHQENVIDDVVMNKGLIKNEDSNIDYGNLVPEDHELFNEEINEYIPLNNIASVNYTKEDPEGYDGAYEVKLKDGSTRVFGWKHSGPLEEITEESSPMNEFSGPDREGPSFAQMDTMDAMIENAFKNGQTPQQVVDSVKYDLDIEDGSPELKTLMDKVRNYNKNPSEPQYKKSDLTNIKVLNSRKYHDLDKDEDVEQSLVEYTPYGDKDNPNSKRMYGVVNNYKGEPIWRGGAIVAPSQDLAQQDFDSQHMLGIQGQDRYLKRGMYDEDFYNMLKDPQYGFDDDIRKRYSEKYGWDFNKPFAEHDFMKNDPYKKWQEEQSNESVKKELREKLKLPGDVVESLNLTDEQYKILNEWFKTKRM